MPDDELSLADLKERLNSGDPQKQDYALRDARSMIDTIVEAAVAGFVHASNPTIYAERLFIFGKLIVPSAERLYASLERGATRTSLAILLLRLGSRMGIEDVFQALKIDDPDQFLAASSLANEGITQATASIMNLLQTHVFQRPLNESSAPKLAALINALAKLGVGLPADIKTQLLAPETSRFVKALVEK